MRTIFRLLVPALIPASLLLHAYSGGSPGRRTGSPGDNGITCKECHVGFDLQEANGWIAADIDSAGYRPDSTYTVTVSGYHPDVVRFGFEITSEDTAGAKKGVFLVVDTLRTRLANYSNGITHRLAGITPANDSNSWVMEWVAPGAGSGPVTFYAALNAANGDENLSGDQIYITSLAVSEFIPQPAIISVDPDHAEQGWEGLVTITGEHTSWTAGVGQVIFRNHEDTTQSFPGLEVTPVSDTLLLCTTIIPPDQLVGNYDLSVDSLMMEQAFAVELTTATFRNPAVREISIFPNPATKVLRVKGWEGASARIIGTDGITVWRASSLENDPVIDISLLHPGIYLFHATLQHEVAVLRFLKH